MTLPTNKAAGQIITSSHVNAISTVANTVEDKIGAFFVAPAGTGVAATDTAMLVSALASLPAIGGTVQLRAGSDYQLDSQITLSNRQRIVGLGGQNNNSDTASAPTTIHTSYNGSAFRVNASGVSMEDLIIFGDRSLGSQILLDMGDNSTAKGYNSFRNMWLSHCGLYSIRLQGLCVYNDFELMHIRKAVLHGLYSTGTSNNSNRFASCKFRENDQWGVYWDGGKDCHFDTCAFETNSRHATLNYGGIRVASGTWGCQLKLTACHFENNLGVALGGVPMQTDVISAHGGGPTAITEDATVYSETNANVLSDGRNTAVGIITNLIPHATIAATHDGAVYVNPTCFGGTFGLTDGAGNSTVIGRDNAAAKVGIVLGGDTTMTRDTTTTWRVATGNEFIHDGAAASTILKRSRVTADAQPRHYDRVDGYRFYGDGTSTPDCFIGRTGANAIEVGGAELRVNTVGRGLRVKEGSNAKQGTAVLVAGSVVVSNTSVTASSRILLTSNTDGGTPGWLRVSARTAATSFTITSSSGTDTSTVAYQIFEPS